MLGEQLGGTGSTGVEITGLRLALGRGVSGRAEGAGETRGGDRCVGLKGELGLGGGCWKLLVHGDGNGEIAVNGDGGRGSQGMVGVFAF